MTASGGKERGSGDRHPVAFLVHPRTDVARDFGGLCRPLGLIPTPVYEGLMRRVNLPSVVTGRLRYADAPQTPAGWLITVPLSPRQLLEGGARVQAAIGSAVDRARDLGARTVGLGALTAPATGGGGMFRHRQDIGITNGNAFTAAMTFLGVQRLLAQCPPGARIAVVGASGSVGSCLSQMLSARTGNPLLLVARHEGRLRGLQARLGEGRAEISTDMARVRGADLVVLLTSAPDALLRSEHLGLGAIVLDDTQPRNTRPELLLERPDVRIVDGGLVRVPGLQRRGFLGLPQGVAFACLAETLLLGLAGYSGHFALGAPSVAQADFMLHLAGRFSSLGFTLAAPHSFGEPVCLEPRPRPPIGSLQGVPA